jgi:hypothetical protein
MRICLPRDARTRSAEPMLRSLDSREWMQLKIDGGRGWIRPDTNQHPRQILFIFLFNSLSQSCWLRSLSFLPRDGVRLGVGSDGVRFTPVTRVLLLAGASRSGLKSDCVEIEVRDIGTPLNQTSAHAPQATRRAPTVPRTRNCTTFMWLLGQFLCELLGHRQWYAMRFGLHKLKTVTVRHIWRSRRDCHPGRGSRSRS